MRMLYMPRTKKWRKISFIPESNYFIPMGVKKSELEEIQLKLEEVEAIRLKDIEGMHQVDCAREMGVSRQTFQLILDEARKKTAIAITTGKAINISGGNYTYNICKYYCESCASEFVQAYEKDYKTCPKCGESKLECLELDHFCKKKCDKKCCKK